MKVSVDFDGTITMSGDPKSVGFNKIRPGCKEALDRLSEAGIEFYLLTGREEKYVHEAVSLCKKWGLPIDTDNPTRKTISDVYIDDKNLGCTGISWDFIAMQLIEKLAFENIKKGANK